MKKILNLFFAVVAFIFIIFTIFVSHKKEQIERRRITDMEKESEATLIKQKADEELLKANSDPTLFRSLSSNFAWRVLEKEGSTSIYYVIGDREDFVTDFKGSVKCVVENMYDAPVKQMRGLEFPIVKCKLDDKVEYILRQDGFVKSIYSKESCIDFTNCKKTFGEKLILRID